MTAFSLCPPARVIVCGGSQLVERGEGRGLGIGFASPIGVVVWLGLRSCEGELAMPAFGRWAIPWSQTVLIRSADGGSAVIGVED